jgi:Rieske Fe-S protein
MNNEELVIVSQERRDFLMKALAAGTFVCIGSLLSSIPFSGCNNNNPNNPVSSLPAVSPVIDLSTQPALQTVGGAAMLHLSGLNNGNNIIIIRMTATNFVAYSSICTHQGAQVNLPSSPGANIVCPQHGSQFREADGSVALGPASLPLPKFSAVFDQQKNTVTIA